MANRLDGEVAKDRRCFFEYHALAAVVIEPPGWILRAPVHPMFFTIRCRVGRVGRVGHVAPLTLSIATAMGQTVSAQDNKPGGSMMPDNLPGDE